MKKIIITLIITFSALSLTAQTKTSYFVKNSTLNHELNPAFAPKQGYIGFPLLSNINMGVFSNLGAATFLFPMENDELALFLNENVSPEQFLDKLSNTNYLNGEMKMDIMNAGWYGGRGDFWTINMGAKAELESSVPLEFFKFLKLGMQSDPQSYSIKDLSFGGKVFGELSLGYSSRLNDVVKGLRIGAKLKLWLGILDMNVKLSQMDIMMSSDSWLAHSIADGRIYCGGLNFSYNENGYINDFSLDAGALGISGFGGGFDLGAEYTISEGTPVDGLRFSLSLADVGWMRYFKNKSTILKADGSVNYHGFHGINSPDMDFESETDKINDDLTDMLSFKDSPAENGMTEFFGATLYIGADYTFFENKMNAGILYTGKFNKINNLNELTFAYNYTPVEWFDVALSYSVINTRSAIGMLLTFTPKVGLNFFLGSDYINLYYTPQGIPVNHSYVNINLGISVPLNKNFPK